MGTDRARRTYDAGRMYRSVVSQQGRVTLEADANEAEEIRAGEARAALADVIGPTGSPDHGFEITVPATLEAFDFAIGAGTLYVGGVRLQSTARAATYRGQRHTEWADGPFAAAASAPTPLIRELVYLVVTEQEVGAVEDPALREVALGGPDTAARTRMIQRVQRTPIEATSCEDAFAEALPEIAGEIAGAASWDRATMQLMSALRLKAGFVAPTGTADPCQPVAQAGFLGAENQLIRVQIGAGGTTMLWAYDNASALYRVKVDEKKPRQLTLEAAPVDVFHHPKAGQWAEVLVTTVDLGGDARIASPSGWLARVDSYEPGERTLKLDADLPQAYVEARRLQVFVRIWENQQDFGASDTTPVELATADGAGIGVRVWTRGGVRIPGDFWMIGVRPTVPDQIYPARLANDFQPPDGPHRWIVPLAVIAWKGPHSATVSDCRRHFRPLTEDDDLELHNRHLHGWGVVCGLQVQCLPIAGAGNLARPHERVIVRDGYAIHPSGADIRLRTVDGSTTLPLGDLAVAEKAIARNNDGQIVDGSISLWIGKDRTFHAERYVPPGAQRWEERLEGTLLADIYNDCVPKVRDFLRSQLFPSADEGPVGPAARRRIALINLFMQLARPGASSRIYLSGAPGPLDETEDALLRGLFDGLKDLAQSKTFCAMFDDVAYPPYDVYRAALPRDAPRPTTIFGAGGHTRLRVNSERAIAFTCGADGKVNAYDLKSHRFLQALPFPIPGANVQDIAFSPTQNEVYAIAWVGAGHTDSAFVHGAIGNDRLLRWSADPPLRLAKTKLVTLATAGRDIYAAARGQGIYRLTVSATPTGELVDDFRFHATGHLVAGRFGDRGETMLFAGVSYKNPALEPEPGAFDFVWGFPLGDRRRRYFRLPLDAHKQPGIGQDDLAVIPSGRGYDNLYAIIDGVKDKDGRRKRLVAWDPHDDASLDDSGAAPQIEVDLGVSMLSRIAYSATGKWAMITYYDGCFGRVYVPGKPELEPELHPLQLGPISIAADVTGSELYVLERGSNTITAIPAPPGDDKPWRSTIDLDALVKYRRLAIAAFMKMAGRVVQFLKDSACENLLIECPTGAGKVYLADVSFKDGKVYQICNFGRRKYVHSFPTVEYWMSLIPVLPLLEEAIAKACCTVITGFFDELVPPEKVADKQADSVMKALVRGGLGYAMTSDPASAYKVLKAQAVTGRDYLKAAVIDRVRTRIPEPRPPAITHAELPKTEPEATALAAERGLAVRRTEVATAGALVEMVRGLPPAPGDTVDLLTAADGRVLGWRRVTPGAPAAAPSAPAGDDLAELRRQLAELSGAHARQVAAMEQALKAQGDVIETLQGKHAAQATEIEGLKGTVRAQAEAIKTLEPQAAVLGNARRLRDDPRRLAALSPRGRELVNELVELDDAIRGRRPPP